MTHTYYIVSAVHEDEFEREELYGSYNRGDARYELQAEKEGWKADGYKLFAITTEERDEAPDPEVYPELY